MKVLHLGIRDASTTRRDEGGLHSSIYGNKLLRYLCSYHLRIPRKYRRIAFILISAACVAKGRLRNRFAKFPDCREPVFTHCEQACLRSHLPALETSSLAYGSWLERLGAINLADEQRSVRFGSRSPHIQLSDRYRWFYVCYRRA